MTLPWHKACLNYSDSLFALNNCLPRGTYLGNQSIYVNVKITQNKIITITTAISNGKYYMTSNKGAEKTQAQREVVTLLFGDTKKAFFAAILAASLLLIALRHDASIERMTAWSLMILAAYGLRFAIGVKFQREAFTVDVASKWLRRFRWTTLLCGLAWGSIGYFIFPENSSELQAFLSLALAGVAAGGLISYSIDEVSSILFVGGIGTLMSGHYLMSNTATSKYVLFLTVIFVFYVGVASKRLAKGLMSNMSLRIHAVGQQKEIQALSLRQKLHLEHTPLGVIEWDEKLTITSWNKACTDMLGYSLDEAIGMHISFILPEMINKPKAHILHLLSESDNNLSNLKVITHKNGSKVDCEWFNTVLKDEAGEFIGIASLLQDKTEFIKTQAKIHQLAYYDSLTNLPNRGLLLDRLNHTIEMSERSKTHAMVAFFDLDHFKAINDIKGHAAGDFLLKTIAKRIQNVIRKQDTIARIGGDEFVLVLADVGKTKQKAQAYSQKIIEKISSAIKAPLEFDGYQHQCSASIGICIFKGNAVNGDELLRRADMSMYLAKKQGRNCYQFYDETLQPKYDYQMQLKHDLSFAIANNQLELFLQGQFNRDATSIGAEVLLRWQHPEFGLVMPADFIPLAEETGLIVPIGFWVMRQSCILLKKWESSPDTKDMTLSVNVSAIQFNNPEFITQVEVALKSAGCDASKLCIELTESAVIHSIEDLSHKMMQLKEMGISLAIDDFGIGYSSLSVLKNLPLNELKIDKSFVQDIATGSVESSIVQTILQMGKNLNLRIVAEGVESEHQLTYLRNFGCNVFQGYFFERPCSVEIFENNLNAHLINTLPILPTAKKAAENVFY
jgi:diguanylate cyclase (GGDEF)-like protein/PAS domain S-box-containing protein